MWGRLLRHRAVMVGGVVLIIMYALAILAPAIAPYDPNDAVFLERLRPPSQQHLLGTDHLGRDVLSRLLYGSRISLLVGLASVAMAMATGIAVGVTSGYVGGRVDVLLMRITDAMMAFPALLLAFALLTLLGSGLENVILAIGITTTPRFARLVRGTVLSTKENDYVTSARSLGASDLRIVFHHILPNILPAIIVMASLRISTAIITEANLSFLGLGISLPTATWGNMIAGGREFIVRAPWMVMFPGTAITLTVLVFNLTGDGLRDALDPRLQE